jgi:hypothetical protein
MEELWFMPPGEEIDMNGTFDFLRLNVKSQKMIRIRTMAMTQVLGENEDRMIVLFRRLLRTMCAETGKAGKSVQSRLDACKLSVHCLYDIALNDTSEGKMVKPLTKHANARPTLSDVFLLFRYSLNRHRPYSPPNM